MIAITGTASSWFEPIRQRAAPASAALLLALAPVSGEAQVRLEGTAPGRPSVLAEVVPGSLVRQADAVSLRISVEIPRQHHGYLDRGDDGFFIPFTFSFPDIEGTEARVEATAVPPGARDDKVRAQVLRGRGEFAFRLGPASGLGTQATALLRYQICDDMTERCYPPARLTIPIVLSPP